MRMCCTDMDIFVIDRQNLRKPSAQVEPPYTNFINNTISR
jgi:hypothetical protein